MYDTNSPLIVGFILLFMALIIATVIYFILKLFVPKKISLFLVLVALGSFFRYLNPWNYIFYLVGGIFLLLFLIDLFRNKKNKIGAKK